MKRLYGAVALIALIGLASPAQAAGQVDGVNIVYPIDGGSYPITDPRPGGLGSAYFASSFSVKCGGGPGTVKWGFNGSSELGSARFYDQTSVQFVHKLPGGGHYFWVRSDCGKIREGTVKFRIGS